MYCSIFCLSRDYLLTLCYRWGKRRKTLRLKVSHVPSHAHWRVFASGESLQSLMVLVFTKPHQSFCCLQYRNLVCVAHHMLQVWWICDISTFFFQQSWGSRHYSIVIGFPFFFFSLILYFFAGGMTDKLLGSQMTVTICIFSSFISAWDVPRLVLNFENVPLVIYDFLHWKPRLRWEHPIIVHVLYILTSSHVVWLVSVLVCCIS